MMNCVRLIVWTWCCFLGTAVVAGGDLPVDETVYDVGVATVDITPDYPIRLSGFGFRRTESEGVTQRIFAKAIALSQGGEPPLVALTVDNLGVPAAVHQAVLDRLNKDQPDAERLPPERLAICSSHTHTAPMLRNVAPTLFSLPIPPDHQQHIDRYTDELTVKLADVAQAAIAARKPARLQWGIGKVGFAINRRAGGGPIDHDLPLLAVRNLDGTTRAVWISYACHCVTLSNNRISGDWAGFAQSAIEAELVGTTALVSIGCGADQNPNSGVTGDKVDVAAAQGAQIAAEVKRLLGGFLAPVRGALVATRKSIDLPLADLPPRGHWEELAKRQDAVGYHARVNLGRLDRNEPLKTKIEYPISTWTCGDSLALIFLPGEVVVDYAVRLKRELDAQRVWIQAYANDAPCYVPSERILREGGYEGGGAMVYYDVPVPFKPGLEEPIVATATAPLKEKFAARIDPKRTQGSLPLSPQQSLALIRPRAGLRVQLVAAEPLVVDPVAIDFGPDGRLWVAEMHDYPNGLDGKFAPGGRVRVLRDVNGDGVFDESQIFLDKLPFPTGLTVWRKGVLVCAAPDVIYAEDADGDGRADKVQKLLSGFGTENYQGRVNSLCFGLDGWVYGSCGLFGGDITVHGDGHSVALGNRDFRWQVDTGRLEPATGRTQQSRVRDDWDNWFGCDNSNLARHYVLADHYLRRNPHVPPPPVSVDLAGGAAGHRLYSLLDTAQRFKLSGPANQVTAACGLGVYRDDLLGKQFTGNLFTCEPVNLVVHRRVLTDDGSSFHGERAADEQTSEFLASTDNWFRPVQVRTGPDGALWVVDMYRYVIEHPRWIPPEIVAELDVRAGDSLGRIYRVLPAVGTARPIRPLDQLDAAGLVAALDTPNGPQRDLAGQMLAWQTERAERPQVARHLSSLFRTSTRPEARLQALVTLDELEQLKIDDLLVALRDPHPGVRRHAVRIAESFPEDEARVAVAIRALVDDSDAQVRLQVACSLGRDAREDSGAVLARLALKYPQDPYLTGAVLSSLNSRNAAAALRAIIGRPDGTDPPEQFLGRVVTTAAASADAAGLSAILESVVGTQAKPLATWQWSAVAGLLDALDRRGKPLAGLLGAADQNRLQQLTDQARQTIQDPDAPVARRIAAIRLVGRQPTQLASDLKALGELLSPQTPPTVLRAALTALSRINDDRVPDLLVASWASHTPATQAAVFDALLSRPAWHAFLVEQLESQGIPVRQLDAPRRQQLTTQLSGELRRRAETALAASVSPDRQKVIADYRQALQSPGDKQRGQVVFTKRCAACHRLGDAGHEVGPNLAALANKTIDALLIEILDPNRNVDSRYVQYVAATSDGRTVSGLLAAESATSITLRSQEAKQVELLRAELDELKTTGKSLMPEGFERDISTAEMADLVAMLTSTMEPPKKLAGNEPAIVTAGVGGALALRGANAEIRGGDITFETPFRNIGYWHGVKDHAAWTVETKTEGQFDLYLDYACHPDSADNAFAIDGPDPPVAGRIASTGGWDQYRQMKLATVQLAAGRQRITLRPDGAELHGALADVRAILLVPAGKPVPAALLDSDKPPAAPTPSPPTPSTPTAIAARLLDDAVAAADRQKLAEQSIASAGPVVAALVADLKTGTKEEYRRIPWIWRVAIAAGKQNDAAVLRALLAASLPELDEPLRDWQAVVIGGGIVNGISQRNIWPGPRLHELVANDAKLAARWQAALKLATAMADNESVPMGTRYDALRIVALDDWPKRREQLERYLAQGIHAELQMGAVSGLVDVDQADATRLLVGALGHLDPTNRGLAVTGLTRDASRQKALLDALESGQARPEWLNPSQRQALHESAQAQVRERAKRLLP